MMDKKWRSRLRASLIHLGASALVAGTAALLIFLLWYPWPYSVLAGGVGLFVLITSVDVVMGPLVTLIIFNPVKPRRELVSDLSIVILLQLCALGYGLGVMFTARPVVMAFEGQRFRIVTAAEVVLEELPIAQPDLKVLSMTGPVVVGTEAPTDIDSQMEAIERAFAGADLGMRPKYWRPWDSAARMSALAAAKPMSQLQQRYATRRTELDAATARTGRSPNQLLYLPLLSRYADWVVLVDSTSGEIAGFAPFNAY